MNRPSLSLLATFTTALVGFPRAAEPCSPPIILTLDEELPESGLTDVPVEGLVPVFITTSDAFDLDVVVVAGDGAAIAGSFGMVARDTATLFGSISTGRLVWRAAAALEPSAAYQMTITNRRGFVGPITLAFVTSDGGPPPAPSFTFADMTLTEDAFASESVCCLGLVGQCTPDCYALATSIRYSNTAELGLTAASGRYLTIEVTDGATVSAGDVLSPTSAAVAVNSSELSDEHCLTVEVTSLVDGQTAERSRCITARSLVDGTPAPILHAADVCERFDDEPGNQGGCSAGGGRGTAGAIVFVLLVGLARRRRSA